MTNTIEAPFVLRELRGRFVLDGDASPAEWVDHSMLRFQVNGPRGVSIHVPVSPDGTFHLPGLRPGRYCFRTSSEYLQGYEGVIVIDPRASDVVMTIKVALGA